MYLQQQESYTFWNEDLDIMVVMTHRDPGLWTFVFFKDKLHSIINS